MNAAGISMDKTTAFIRENNAERVKQGDLEHMVRKAMEMGRISTELGIETRAKYGKQLRELGGENNLFLASLMENNALSIDTIETLYDEADAYAEKQKTLDAVTTSTNIANGMTQQAAQAATDAANANKTQAESIQKVMDAQHAATDPVFAAIKAQMDARKAQQDYNEAVAAGKSGGDEGLRLTLAQAEAATAYRDAIGKLDIAQLKGDSTSEKVMSALVQLRQFGFEPTAAQVAMLTDAIGANQLKLIAMKDPAQAMTDVLKEMEAQGVTPTKTAIDGYIGTLRAMEAKLSPDDPMRANIDDTIARLVEFGNLHPDVTATVRVDDAAFNAWVQDNPLLATLLSDEAARQRSGVGVGVRVRATGGLVTGGLPYMIGERGPEMFVPQGPGSIISADRVASMSVASSAPGATYITNVTANVHLPAGANGKDVVDAITKYERYNGKVFARA